MSDFVTCDLYDEHTDQVRVLEPIFQNFGGNERFAGKIVTIKCHEDNSLVKDQVALAGEGRVLVVDGGGPWLKLLVDGACWSEMVGYTYFGLGRVGWSLVVGIWQLAVWSGWVVSRLSRTPHEGRRI